MKKILSIVLALCLVWAVSGCNKTPDKEHTSNPENTPYEGLGITILDVSREGENVTLKVRLTNGTEHEVTYGEMFGLQKWEKGQWIPLEMKENTAFIAIGYGLSAGETVEKDYSIGWAYDLSEPGSYRFTTECYLNDNRVGSRYQLYADFVLEGESVTADDGKLPQLKVYSGTEQVNVVTGGYSWAQYLPDGMMSMTIADSLHPLQMEKTLTKYHTTNDRVRLNFSRQPDSWEVRCWPDHMLRDGDVSLFDSQSESVMVYDEEIYLKAAVDGGYVYEITARWEETPNQSYGSVTYVFWINSYPVEPLSTEIMPR